MRSLQACPHCGACFSDRDTCARLGVQSTQARQHATAKHRRCECVLHRHPHAHQQHEPPTKKVLGFCPRVTTLGVGRHTALARKPAVPYAKVPAPSAPRLLLSERTFRSAPLLVRTRRCANVNPVLHCAATHLPPWGTLPLRCAACQRRAACSATTQLCSSSASVHASVNACAPLPVRFTLHCRWGDECFGGRANGEGIEAAGGAAIRRHRRERYAYRAGACWH
jgi:hypothetical protein